MFSPTLTLIFPLTRDWSMFVRKAVSRAFVFCAVPFSLRDVTLMKYWVFCVPPLRFPVTS